ncbi:hypothetical protein [Bartonella sp. CB178]|uniref:hypothetical protein n=1 Tax=Bartonella sp. CB178 TaxID=3112255 RepID=UPI00300E4357
MLVRGQKVVLGVTRILREQHFIWRRKDEKRDGLYRWKKCCFFALRVKKKLKLKKWLKRVGISPINILAQSRTCLWVSAGPEMVMSASTVPGAGRSSRFFGYPKK